MADTLGKLIKKHDSSHDEAASEAIDATNVFIPGYTKGSDAKVEDSEGRDVNFENHDLSDSSLQALSEYASTRLAEEAGPDGEYPASAVEEATGHTRKDVLRREPHQNGNPFARGYLAGDNDLSNDQTELSPFASTDLTKKIGNKNVDGASLGSMLRDLKFEGKTSFGTKQAAQLASPPSDDIPAATFDLLKTNRYNPSENTPFALREGLGDAQLPKGMYTLQPGLLGKYDPSAPAMTVKRLRRAALEILHRAQSVGKGGSEIVARQMDNEGTPFTLHAELLAIIPHVTQVGAGTVPDGIDALRVRDANVIKTFLSDGGVTNPLAGNDHIIKTESGQSVLGAGGNEDPILKAISRNQMSFGTMNSPSEPFDGVAPFGMIIPVIFSIVVLGLLGLAFGAIQAGLAKSSNNPPIDPDDPSQFAFGRNLRRIKGGDKPIGELFMELYGFPRDGGTKFFSMVTGIMLFYGMNFNPFSPGAMTSGTDVAEGFINILMGPGYYLTISKKVLADFEQVTKAFGNYSNITGPFSFITIILSSIEALMSSFTVRWFFTMNNIGVIAETARLNNAGKAHGTTVTPINEQKDEGHAGMNLNRMRNSISRFYPHAGKAGMNPLSAILHNAAFLRSEDTGLPVKIGDQIDGPMTLLSHLTPESAAAIEERIDGEYMPFSIQDLRTREIVSLPAFITSLNDDFSADYNSSQGFGRTDPVRIYSKTTRSIALSFTMVAFSEKDHEYIWYVINRFVSMMYPQRDAGKSRTLELSSGKKLDFTQPFSQVVASSPVVRIRVGDVIASNASITNFAKIFGGKSAITQTDLAETLRNNGAMSAFQKISSLYFAYRTLKTYSMWSGENGAFQPESADCIAKTGTRVYLLIKDSSDSTKFYQTTLRYPIKLTGGSYGKTGSPDAPVHEFEIEVADEKEAFALGNLTMLAAFRGINTLVIPPEIPMPPAIMPDPPKLKIFLEANSSTADNLDFSSVLSSGDAISAIRPGGDFPDVMDLGYEILRLKGMTSTPDPHLYRKSLTSAYPIGDISVIDNWKKQIEADLALAKGNLDDIEKMDVTGEDLKEFFSFEGNPILKSFKMSGGEGLAGVITQMGLNYDQASWGTTPLGEGETQLRAPMMVNINLSFAPIHDLPLGLNHKGEMFAPSHPVGVLSKNHPKEKLRANGILAGSPLDARLAARKEAAINGVTKLPSKESTKNPGNPFQF